VGEGGGGERQDFSMYVFITPVITDEGIFTLIYCFYQ